MSIDTNTIQGLYAKYPKLPNETFTYGTAGFRMNATKLDSIVFATGLLASLRSKCLDSKTIGIMITASHNPPQDNGVKIVDPFGEMLDQNWEPLATKLANCENYEAFESTIQEIIKTFGIDMSLAANVVIARDSRESGERLLNCATDGCKSLKASYKDFGLLTTPQLHYLVRSSNDTSFGNPTESSYYEKLANAFKEILKVNSCEDNLPIEIGIDCANGIGAEKVSMLSPYMQDYVNFTIVNGDYKTFEALNVNCGADYVKTGQKLPSGVEAVPLKLYSSFDGDADRVVFYYVDDEFKQFKLLDGDKIATLLTELINSLLSNISNVDLKLGMIQTAYANGNSTKFAEDSLKVSVDFTKTGVKHLHHQAQKYDIGVYFEANGHGTVLFSENYVSTLAAHKSSGNSKEDNAVKTLLLLEKLINQTVGDSISDLLTVLIALKLSNKTPKEWNAEYTDLPNRLLKVIVKDRFMFKTTNAERTLTEPAGLQDKIDELVSKYKNGRSFVRASGTEDAVRVYAEAETKDDCEALANAVSDAVKQFS